ncbi:thiol reductant ABC exporter subunit CydC [Sanguibacter sp. HDW7]|uniref:thiol reductant ABC exporter subunit CydC n=1 Tax=Sanguibacter sp. HDW7 TaxID=2714931 RepID=UPI0014098945|nr:thiol reductant ABC exporter subunit CydC [Sanguibacter sp. HDW7]QIK82813.1 thiol reductant ABC exporter subunit CydC [Sanguibacter sp. HDW7]
MRRADTRRLLALTRSVLPPLLGSLVMRLLGLATGAALLVVAARAVADSAAGRAPGAWAVLGTLALVALGKGAARYLEQYLGHLVAFRSLAILRVHFFRTLEPQAPAATDGRRTGDLVARVTRDVDRVEVFFAHTLVPATSAVIVGVAGPFVVGAWTHPALGVVTAVAFAVSGLAVPRWRARRTDGLARDLRVARGRLAQHVTDDVQGVREILAFDATERRLAELDGLGEESGRALRGAGDAVSVRRAAGTALVPVTVLVLAWVGAGLVAAGSLGWPELVTAIALVLGLFPALTGVEEFVADLDQAFASARRLFEITDAPPATADPADPVALAPATGGRAVRFEGVRFAYPAPDDARALTPALDGIDLDLAAGSTTALVGASGAGKSTVVQMLLRAFDPDVGRVALDGTDVRDLTLADLRAQVALVPQRPYLFHATLRENLLLARPAATDAELADALARARLTDVVEGLPQGLDTRVGEHGTRLSGGQRQRVAIARAFLQDAPVLVLDEATSQLDATTQAGITAALAELAAGRTVVQIAHRLETVRHADRIVVLDAGRVLESGTHDELVASDGAYAALLARG